MKSSAFRHFCNEMWYLHCDEILAWTNQMPGYDSTYYFRKHRWLLRKMFQEQGLTNRTYEGTILTVANTSNVH